MDAKVVKLRDQARGEAQVLDSLQKGGLHLPAFHHLSIVETLALTWTMACSSWLYKPSGRDMQMIAFAI